MQDKTTFAVNGGAIDSKWQRSHASVTEMRRPQGLVQRIPRRCSENEHPDSEESPATSTRIAGTKTIAQSRRLSVQVQPTADRSPLPAVNLPVPVRLPASRRNPRKPAGVDT